VIGDGKTLFFGQPIFQASDDLAGASEGEGNCVPEDFASCHGSIEHKENERASRYILCMAALEAPSR
jgi:hypothetical protein